MILLFIYTNKSKYLCMISYQMWGMALGNESHKFDFSDNSTNVVPIHNLIWFPINLSFYHHLTLFIIILSAPAVKFHKEMFISSFFLPHTISYEGFISKPEPS